MREVDFQPPRLWLLFRDETECYVDWLRERASNITGVYLYNSSVHVHCCEIQPSYLCRYLASTAQPTPDYDTPDDLERLDAELMDANADAEDIYLHVRVVDALFTVDTQRSGPPTVKGKPARYWRMVLERFTMTPEEWATRLLDNDGSTADAEDEYMNEAIEYLQGNPCW